MRKHRYLKNVLKTKYCKITGSCDLLTKVKCHELK